MPFSQRFQHLLPGLFQRLLCLLLFSQRALPQLFSDGLRQVLVDPALDDLAFVVHDAVDAKVQVSQVELKELVQ